MIVVRNSNKYPIKYVIITSRLIYFDTMMQMKVNAESILEFIYHGLASFFMKFFVLRSTP